MSRRPVTPFRTTKIGRTQRIRVPAHPDRPIKLHTKDLLRPLVSDPWWFIEHRHGPRRPLVGADPLEVRAVPYSKVRGYLHERVEYKFLTDRMQIGRAHV